LSARSPRTKARAERLFRRRNLPPQNTRRPRKAARARSARSENLSTRRRRNTTSWMRYVRESANLSKFDQKIAQRNSTRVAEREFSQAGIFRRIVRGCGRGNTRGTRLFAETDARAALR